MRRTFGILLALGIVATSGSPCLADPELPEVVRVDGTAHIRDAAGKPAPPPRVGSRLPAGGSVETGDNGRVVVRLGNAGFAVLDRRSKLEVTPARDRMDWLRHVTGWIYYALHRDTSRKEPVGVRTAVATIGVRGTRFLVVDAPDRSELGMRKGEVSVESLEGEFELHREAQKDEFDAYKKEGAAAVEREQDDFKKFAAETRKEFTEYTRAFSLRADRQVVFDGKRVREQALSAEAKRDMESAEDYAANWLKTVRD